MALRPALSPRPAAKPFDVWCKWCFKTHTARCTRVKRWNLLETLRQRRNLSFIMVSHDLAVVTHLCERLMVMQRGETVELLASADLAAHRVQDAYTLSLMRASSGFQREQQEA